MEGKKRNDSVDGRTLQWKQKETYVQSLAFARHDHNTATSVPKLHRRLETAARSIGRGFESAFSVKRNPLSPLQLLFPPTSRTNSPINTRACVHVWLSSSRSLSRAWMWRQLSSLQQGRALLLLHFILYLPSDAQLGDKKANVPPPEVGQPLL